MDRISLMIIQHTILPGSLDLRGKYSHAKLGFKHGKEVFCGDGENDPGSVCGHY